MKNSQTVKYFIVAEDGNIIRHDEQEEIIPGMGQLIVSVPAHLTNTGAVRLLRLLGNELEHIGRLS